MERHSTSDLQELKGRVTRAEYEVDPGAVAEALIRRLVAVRCRGTFAGGGGRQAPVRAVRLGTAGGPRFL